MWCDGVRTRETDCETLKDESLRRQWRFSARFQPQFDTNSIVNMAESSIISSMRRKIQNPMNTGVDRDLEGK